MIDKLADSLWLIADDGWIISDKLISVFGKISGFKLSDKCKMT
jgi:hypothetical protein